ncbi:MAG TPA: hypothetical protein VGK26_08975 [Thermoanaerobaculia bacterium]|jgi:hypothetical protein
MKRFAHRSAHVAAAIGFWLAASPARPQNIVPPPITITLPNYNTIPIGQVGALEGGERGHADEFFSHVNLCGVTLGLSGQTEHIVASLGVNYVFGNSNDSRLAALLDSDLSVRMIGVIYSLAYKF